MPALVIFAHAIRYLKDTFMKTIQNRLQNVIDTDVNYVLTVPAIWNDMAKRFMREAALEVELHIPIYIIKTLTFADIY